MVGCCAPWHTSGDELGFYLRTSPQTGISCSIDVCLSTAHALHTPSLCSNQRAAQDHRLVTGFVCVCHQNPLMLHSGLTGEKKMAGGSQSQAHIQRYSIIMFVYRPPLISLLYLLGWIPPKTENFMILQTVTLRKVSIQWSKLIFLFFYLPLTFDDGCFCTCLWVSAKNLSRTTSQILLKTLSHYNDLDSLCQRNTDVYVEDGIKKSAESLF